MNLMTPFHQLSIDVSITDNNKLKFRGLASLNPEQRAQIEKYARENKQKIMAVMTQAPRLAGTEKALPGDCENCPACATWDYSHYAGKRLCFHRAYFIGRAGNPVDIQIARAACPLNNQQ